MQAGKKKNGVKLGGGARNRCKFDHDHFLVLIVTIYNIPTCMSLVKLTWIPYHGPKNYRGKDSSTSVLIMTVNSHVRTYMYIIHTCMYTVLACSNV